MDGKISALLLSIAVLCASVLSGCAKMDGNDMPESTPQNLAPASTPNENEFYVSDQLIYEYQTERLYASRDGKQIYGVVYIPQNAGERMPAIIYSHGFGGSLQYGTQYAEAMSARGYVVYCFDFCGGSPGSRSDGSTLEMSLFTEQADLEAVIKMIQKLDYVDSSNLFLLGTSQGGAVSALAGAKHPDEIKGMVLLYPAFVMVDNANELFRSAEEIPDAYYFMWMNVGRTYFATLLDYDIYADITDYTKDILILHGDADSIVPLSYSEKAVEVYSSAQLKILPGAGHGFYGDDADQAIGYITEYLNAHID